MERRAKISFSIAIRIKEGSRDSCSFDLGEALKREVGDNFIEAKFAQAGNALWEVIAEDPDVCVINLIFPGSATRAVFERESMANILDRIKLKTFDILAVSHTPFEYVECEY